MDKQAKLNIWECRTLTNWNLFVFHKVRAHLYYCKDLYFSNTKHKKTVKTWESSLKKLDEIKLGIIQVNMTDRSPTYIKR